MDSRIKPTIDQIRATYIKKYYDYYVEIAKSYEKNLKKLKRKYRNDAK